MPLPIFTDRTRFEAQRATMPISPRKRWMTGSCVGLVVAVVIGGFWATRTHTLHDRATRITENSFAGYAWTSPEKLILVLPATDASVQSFVERNITTGAQTLGTFGSALIDGAGWRPSPDGQRLLASIGSTDFYAVGLREAERIPRGFSNSHEESQGVFSSAVAWLPDSRRWLAWAPSQTSDPLHLYSVDAPREANVSIPSPKAMTMLLGVTPDNVVVQTDVPNPQTTAEKVTVTTFGVYPNRTPVKSFSISLPVTAQIKELEMAPRGDRLAWLFVDSRRPTLIQMLVRAIPSLASRFQPTLGCSLWVSRLDGTEMNEIGFEQTQANAKSSFVPFDLRWLPDGRRLSFRMNAALYTIPAP